MINNYIFEYFKSGIYDTQNIGDQGIKVISLNLKFNLTFVFSRRGAEE